MTREEQIENAARHYSIKASEDTWDRPDWEDIEWAFQEGAEWADSHPAFNLPEILGRESKVWLLKCCDAVRTTKMSQDLKEQLINTFMRL